jgi:hypothetical protein
MEIPPMSSMDAALAAAETPARGRLVAFATGAGLIAGLVAWGVDEPIVHAFRPPTHVQHVMGQAIERANFEDRAAADAKNATLAYAVLGLVLGVGLGAAGGMAGRSSGRAVKGATAGGVLGTVFAAGAALVLLPIYFRAEDKSQGELARDLMIPLLVHAGSWAAAGLAAGIAYGIGRGGGKSRIANAALGGALGGALGAVLYEVVCASTLPHSGSTTPLAWSMTARLLARVLVAVGVGFLAAVVADMPHSRPASKAIGGGSVATDAS